MSLPPFADANEVTSRSPGIASGRSLVLLLALAALATCSPREPMGPVGVSTGGASTAEPPSIRASSAAPPSPLPVEYRATFAKIHARRFVAQGHAGGRFDADVYVTPAARGSILEPSAPIAAGTVLVMDQSPRARSVVEVPSAPGGSATGPTLMMEKRPPGFDPAHGDWRYVVVDGQNVSDGPIALCARCHDEAPHDHVFPIAE